MKNYIAAAAILSVSLLGAATKAADQAALKDAEYSLVQLEFQLNVSADEAWKRMWPFCEIHIQLGRDCKIVKGNGTDIGSDRRIGTSATHEVMINKSKYSYTFTQIAADPLYHHSLFEVVPQGPNKSKFVRKWFWERKGTLEADTAALTEKMKVFTPVLIEQAKVAEGKGK